MSGADDVHGADPSQPGDSDDTVDSVETGTHDLNWNVPVWSIAPLAVIVIGLLVAAFGFSALLWSLVPFAVLIAAVTVIDLRELRVPNRITGPAALAAVPAILLASLADWPDVSLTRAVAGAAVMGGVYFVMAMIYPAGMGFGDVKLAPLLGAQLGLFGWIPLVRGLILAFFLVGPVAIVLLLLRKAGRSTGLPFAPFMCVGALIALLLEGWVNR